MFAGLALRVPGPRTPLRPAPGLLTPPPGPARRPGGPRGGLFAANQLLPGRSTFSAWFSPAFWGALWARGRPVSRVFLQRTQSPLYEKNIHISMKASARERTTSGQGRLPKVRRGRIGPSLFWSFQRIHQGLFSTSGNSALFLTSKTTPPVTLTDPLPSSLLSDTIAAYLSFPALVGGGEARGVLVRRNVCCVETPALRPKSTQLLRVCTLRKGRREGTLDFCPFSAWNLTFVFSLNLHKNPVGRCTVILVVEMRKQRL